MQLIVWLILVYFASDISTFDKPTIDLVIPVNNAPLPTKALAFTTNYFKFICIAATTTTTTIPALSVI
jgi:hypothetical protein